MSKSRITTTPQAYQDIGMLVAEAAMDLYEKLGVKSDYKIRSIRNDCVVFGEVNVFVWTAKSGFLLDERWCTEIVKQRWQGIKEIYHE